MSLTLNLPPDVEARIIAEAERTGRSVEDILVHLFNGYFWCNDSELEREWQKQASKREVAHWLQIGRQTKKREWAVDVLTEEKLLKSFIGREERAIWRCMREAILAAQQNDRASALKAFQRKTLHGHKLAELRPRYVTAANRADSVRAELRQSIDRGHQTIIELLRMKINHNQARLHLGISPAERTKQESEDTQIRNFASDEQWERLFEQWIAMHGDVVPDEVPSEVDVLQKANNKNQQQLEKHLNRVQELHEKMKPGSIESKTD